MSAGGKNNAGAGGLDGYVPLVAGNVPIELVVIFKKFDGVGDGVLDGDGLNGIIGVGDVDFEFAVMAHAAGIEFEAVADCVGDIFHGEKQGVVQALRSTILDGNGAIQAVPGSADEVGFDFFGDIDGAVTGDDDVGIEALDAKFFGVDGAAPQSRTTMIRGARGNGRSGWGKAKRNKRQEWRIVNVNYVQACAATASGSCGSGRRIEADLGSFALRGAVSSKNSRGLKPSILAKMLVGNC